MLVSPSLSIQPRPSPKHATIIYCEVQWEGELKLTLNVVTVSIMVIQLHAKLFHVHLKVGLHAADRPRVFVDFFKGKTGKDQVRLTCCTESLQDGNGGY